MRSERIHVSAGIWRNLANCEPPHTDRGSERRYSLFLAEGFLRRGDRTAARSLIGALLETSRARLPERYLPVCPAGRFGQALAVAGALGERPRSWVPTGGSASLGSRQPRDRGRAASQPRRGDLGDSSQTPRWSGMDSNFRFRDAFASPTAPPLPTPPDSPVSGDPSNGRPASRSVCRGWRLLDDTPASRVDRPHIGGSQASRARNRKFESSSLQRRVSNGLFAALGAHDVSGRSTSHRYPMFNIRVSRNHNSRVVCGGRFAPQIRSSTMKQRQPT